mgnify:CR=1 FL=1
MVSSLQNDGSHVCTVKVSTLIMLDISNTNDHVNFVKIDVDLSPNLSTEEKVTVAYVV